MVLLDLDLDDYVVEDNTTPSNIETIYYLFWEKGIDYNRFAELPIPYILKILKTHNWVKQKEQEAYEEAKNKNK